MNSKIIPIALACLVACGEPVPETSSIDQPPASPGGAAVPTHHGTPTDLGTVTVAGKLFGVVRLGDLVPGKEGAFYVHPKGMSATDLASLNIYLWVEDRTRRQLCAATKGSLEGGALHFHVTPRRGKRPPFRVVLRVRTDGVDERVSLPLDGHGHEHAHGSHGGMPAAFKGGGISGHLELKVHDDNGHLELWLGVDAHIARPFDVPLNTSIQIEFIDMPGRKITLRPRNRVENEDGHGRPNVRDGKTNYFIFPTVDQEDTSWTRGAEFESIVVVRFTLDGQSFVSDEFVLKPHVH